MSSLMRGKHQSITECLHPKASLWHPVSRCMLLSPQQGLRCRMGKEKKKKDAGCGEWDSRVWGGAVTHRWGNCFSPGRCLLFSRKMPTTVLKYIQAQKSLQLLPHISPQCLPLHTLPLADSSPLCPPFAGAQGEFLWTSSMCFGPFKKKKKIVALSSVGSISSWETKTLWSFLTECYEGGPSWPWHSGPESLFWAIGFTPTRRGELPLLCCNLSPRPVWIWPPSFVFPSVFPLLSWFLPVLGQKSLLQATFNCLFQIAVPLFMSTSSLVLGGGARRILLLPHHLVTPH